MKINYILKVQDAKAVDIQKALQQAGIKVQSIQEVYREAPPKEPAQEQKQ